MGIDAYKAENAKHGWRLDWPTVWNTGRAPILGPERQRNGPKEEDLQYDERGPFVALAASEVVELRDYLVDALPPAATTEGPEG
ncbi:hypothetical protein ABID21_001353 [Pseudorhizobium tarimense]|uniref:Uncharacterized protein n=1 Tax=Pseudorhizobium tarimense TaxID=1079109 RepID=A0ABV2H3Y3_9HYPH|nr:hypothetical protein [Pseudorhizobium tarimense]MCJ8518336.1 hypothetical protein [Pseudorhizobium tarimense]